MKNKVSIIIPLFNRVNLILETLRSLYNQTYKNWEAIIVDDGSTDNSFVVVENEAKKDDRIKVFIRNREPKGAPTCRNIGIEKSTGKYIIFLDSDDVLAYYCLSERIEYFKENSTLDILVFNGAFFENKPGDTDILWNKFTDEDDLKRFYSGEPVWSITGPIWKKTAIIQNDLLFEETAKSSQDWEFHIKALQKKMRYKKIDILPDYFVRRSQRQALNAISSTHGSYDKLINRIELFKHLFLKNRRIEKKDKNKLFKNLYFQIFNVYTNCTYVELKNLFKQIKVLQLSSNFKHYLLFFFILFSWRFHKLGIKKIHIVTYYLSKILLSTYKNKSYYREKMSKYEYIMLKNKLNEKY